MKFQKFQFQLKFQSFRYAHTLCSVPMTWRKKYLGKSIQKASKSERGQQLLSGLRVTALVIVDVDEKERHSISNPPPSGQTSCSPARVGMLNKFKAQRANQLSQRLQRAEAVSHGLIHLLLSAIFFGSAPFVLRVYDLGKQTS